MKGMGVCFFVRFKNLEIMRNFSGTIIFLELNLDFVYKSTYFEWGFTIKIVWYTNIFLYIITRASFSIDRFTFTWKIDYCHCVSTSRLLSFLLRSFFLFFFNLRFIFRLHTNNTHKDTHFNKQHIILKFLKWYVIVKLFTTKTT